MAIRTIHVGVGGRGRWPVELFPKRDDLQPVALVDVSTENLAAAREKTGLGEDRCFGSMTEALASVEADAAIVITPPQLHAAQCLEAVRAGKHVMVEKPFTMSLADARAVVDEAQQQGVCVVVTQNDRLSAVNATLARLVRERTYGRPQIGQVTKFSMRSRTHHSGQVRHSYLWERGIHDLDTIRAIMGADPVRVWGHSFNARWSPYAHGAGTQACLEFADGAVLAYCCCFATHKRGSSFFLDCEGGSVEPADGKLCVTLPEGGEPEWVELDETPSPTDVIADAFSRYIREGVEPPFSGRENLKTIGLVEAVGAASDRREVIDVATYLSG